MRETGPALFVISALISIVPGSGYLVAAYLFRRFDLDEAEHARIRAALDARAAGVG